MSKMCNKCLLEYCSYEPHSADCQSARVFCNFCTNHCKDDTIYEMCEWDGGIEFDYIKDIKYCPLCGRELDDK